MSIFSSIGKVFKKVAGPLVSAIPGIGPIAGPMVSSALDPAYTYTGKKAAREYAKYGGAMPGMGFTSMPGGRPGGGWQIPLKLPDFSGGSWRGPDAFDFLTQPGGTGGACPPSRTLRDGRVRYARRRADGSYYFPRRMNPLNPRAARRAIRRIKAVRRITRDIERSLPKVTTRRRGH